MLCRAFCYLLQPTARQRVALARLLADQRELYNAALEERRGVWRWERRSVTKFEQFRGLTGADLPVLRWGVCAARGTLTRLDRAFRAFYGRCQSGQAPGFPRFKGEHRWASVEYPDRYGWRLDEERRRLYLQGVGHIKVRLHRPLRGTAKTCTVRREGRRWRVTVFCAGVDPRSAPPADKAVGIDRGITVLAALSDGRRIDNPRWFKAAADRTAAAQQALARCQLGSKRRRVVRERVATTHRKVRNQRRDSLHKLSTALVDEHAVLVLEKLRIATMTRSVRGTRALPNASRAAKRGLNRSILDAGWESLEAMLTYKAEEAGRELLVVDPRHTSQTCATCGEVDARSRVGAVFLCRACGHEAHADVNAAINILRAGLAQRESAKRVGA